MAARSDRDRSGRLSSLSGKTYAARENARQEFKARLPVERYERLLAASDAAGVSVNTIVNEAVESYLTSAELATLIDRGLERSNGTAAAEARRRQQAAIDKLAGRTP